MIGGYRFFELYQAVTLHFKSDSYDFFKYGGKTKVNPDTYLGRKDKYFFERLGKFQTDDEAICFVVANIAAGKKYVLDYDKKIYEEWKSFSDGLSYKFGKEWDLYLTRKHEETPPWEHEPIGLQLIVNMVHAGELSKEWFILTDAVMNGFLSKQLDKTDDFLWQELKKDLELYKPFVIKYWNIADEKINKLKEIMKTKL